MTQADSIRQTTSMARWWSVADTATDHTSFNLVDARADLFVDGLICQLRPFRYFVLDLFFGQDGSEFFHLEDLTYFGTQIRHGMGVGAALDPLDGLFEDLTCQSQKPTDGVL